MKRKTLVAVGGVLAVGALVWVATSHEPSAAPISILKVIQPLNTSSFGNRWIAKTEIIEYSLHMDYDDVVNAADDELSPKGWTKSVTYFAASFTNSATKEQLVIYRARKTLRDGKLARVHLDQPILQDDLPDPHGWVVVADLQAINALTGVFTAAKSRMQKNRNAKFLLVYPRPRDTDIGEQVDTRKGSMDLEGSSLGYQFAN